MKKIKLAIVTPYPPSVITLNEYAYHLIQHFSQKKEISEILLITDKVTEGNPEDHLPETGCPIRVRQTWKFNDMKNLLNIWRTVKQEKPDVVLFNLQFLSFGDKKIPAALGLLAPWILKKSGFPSVVLLHNIMEEVDLSQAGITENKLLTSIFNFIGSNLTRFLLASEIVGVTIEKYVDILRKKYKKQNIALIPHGTFELPEAPDYSRSEGPLKIMTFGKFGTYKKVEILIEAMDKLRNETELDVELVIAGTDNPNVKGYLQDVQDQYADISGIKFTGYVAEEDVPRIFRESDVVVFPYTSTTGSSGVLHQAGSYGKAVVLPDLGDLGRLIKSEGYEGELFDPTSVDSLKDALANVLSNDTHRMNLARKNFAAASSLGMQDITDWYLLHFEKIVANRKAA